MKISLFRNKSNRNRRQQKDRSGLWFKIFLVVASTVAIVYFMPRDSRFDYIYDEGKPWRYGQLIAPWKFPVYKTDSVLIREQDSIVRHFQPYYNVNTRIHDSALEVLNRRKENMASSLMDYYAQRIGSLLDTVYSRGILSMEDVDELNKKGHNAVRVIRNNVARSVFVKDLLSTRSAYEYVVKADTSVLRLSVLQQFNIIDLVQPNLVNDVTKSSVEVEALRQSVSGARGMIQSGEKIIDRGEIVTAEKYEILRSMEQESRKYDSVGEDVPYKLIGQSVFVLLIMVVLVSYLSMFRKDYMANFRYCILLFSLVVLPCIMASLMVNNSFFNVFILPCCMVPLIIRVLMDSRTAFMFHVAMVVIISLFLRYPYEFLIVHLVVGMIAIQNLKELTQRSQIVQTAAIVAGSYIFLYSAYELIQENGLSGLDRSMYIYFIINSVLLLFAYPLLWILEKGFGFVSDVTLVELSNINNPLLRKMTEVAPGTFQHSMQVANLASEAAKVIGARVQLVRTGALYHDIGKMERPVFFTENQAGGNPHKHLTPMKSAEVIIAHVTNGMLLADKNHLPDIVKRFITAHHGKGKTKYFYITYKNEHPNEDVDEALFTYPGPDPASKEEAILMMADSVEAASRSLQEYTEDTISQLVDKVVDAQMADGHFSECDITFKEIAMVKSVFKEKLKIIYHTRISYPELNANVKSDITKNEVVAQ